MKKSFTIFVLLYVIFTYSLSADESRQGIITGKLVPVYEQPDVNSKKLMTLSKNIKFTILKQQQGWYYIKVNNKNGWIENNDTEVINSVPEENVKQVPIEPKETEDEITITKPKTYEKDNSGDSPRINFGFRLGANISNVTGNDIPSTADSRLGLTAGGLMKYNLFRGIFLQTEILYNQKGFTQGDTSSNLDYISVPLLIGYSLNFGKISANANAGLELSYILNKGFVTPDETFVYDDVKSFDTGIAFGAGLGYYINSKNQIICDFRYIMGISTIHDKTIHDVEEMDIINNVLSFSIGYTF